MVRMRRALFGLTLVIGFILIAPAPALAGGSLMEWDAPAYAPGQIATGHGTFFDGCCSRGMAKDGPYFAYLVPADGHGEIPPLPKEAIIVAPLSDTEEGPPWGVALSFTVPDVPAGSYYNVLLCNDPCTEFLGDSMGNGFAVVSSPERAEVQPMVQRVRTKMAKQIRFLRARIEKVELRQRAFESAANQRIDMLSERVAELQRAPLPEGDRSPTKAGAAVMLGTLGIGAIAWVVRRSR